MSDGEIVQIPNRTVFIDNNGPAIVQYIEYFKDYADILMSQLDGAMEDLSDILRNYDPPVTDINIPIPTLDGPPFPFAPSWGALELDDNWPDNPTEPLLMEYGNIDFSYIAPIPPDEIAGGFNWQEGIYTSEMWAALFAKVHGDIVDGGTGLTGPVHTAIVAREQEARRINQDRDYQQALDEVGTDGFNLPSGNVSAFLAGYHAEVLQRDQDAVNALLVKDFDLATENTRFAVTTGKELEQLLRDTYDALQNRSLDAAKAGAEYLVKVYEANIQAYLAKWEGIKLDLEALKMKVDTITSYNDGQVKVYLGKASVFETEIKAIVSKNEGIVDVRQSEVSIYETEVKAIAVQYEALAIEVKAQTEASRLELEQAISNSRINLDAFIAETNLSEKISEAIMLVTSQALASTLGAINTSLSHGYSASASQSEGWSHGESLGETHGFSEE